VVTRVPTLTDFDADIFELIDTGDMVEVDADAGMVTITKAPG
jgi:predicted aconitase with swiveling domain